MESPRRYIRSTPAKPGGLLVAFEGIDGSGKSSAARACVAQLQELGFDAVFLKEPTDGPIGCQIRELFTKQGPRDAEAEFQLFLKDRTWHVKNHIEPVLNRGGIVCVDRYYISSMAYQGALGLDIERIRSANEAIAPAPDLILLFELPVEVALARIVAARPGGANQFEHRHYQEVVSKNFRDLRLPGIKRIDARLPLKEVAEMATQAIIEASGHV